MNNYIKLSEWLKTSDKGLFVTMSEMTDALPLPNPILLDSNLVNSFGDKTVFSKLAVKSVSDVADLIAFTFTEKWESLINATIPTLDSGKLEVISNSKVTNVDEVGTAKTVNKTSAFNDLDLIADTGTDSDTTNKNDKIENGDTTKNIYSIESIIKNLSLSQKTNIITIVLQDVQDYLTHNIY